MYEQKKKSPELRYQAVVTVQFIKPTFFTLTYTLALALP